MSITDNSLTDCSCNIPKNLKYSILNLLKRQFSLLKMRTWNLSVVLITIMHMILIKDFWIGNHLHHKHSSQIMPLFLVIFIGHFFPECVFFESTTLILEAYHITRSIQVKKSKGIMCLILKHHLYIYIYIYIYIFYLDQHNSCSTLVSTKQWQTTWYWWFFSFKRTGPAQSSNRTKLFFFCFLQQILWWFWLHWPSKSDFFFLEVLYKFITVHYWSAFYFWSFLKYPLALWIILLRRERLKIADSKEKEKNNRRKCDWLWKTMFTLKVLLFPMS